MTVWAILQTADPCAEWERRRHCQCQGTLTPMTTPSPAAPLAPVLVVCLCAQWCAVCREYRAVMPTALVGFEATQVQSVWLDVEDQSELLGELDVDNFPTLLVARGGTPLFYGTLAPHAATLTRLVQGALAGELKPLAPDTDLIALIQRL